MKAVTFVTCECGAFVAPIVITTEPGVATTLEGTCPVCLTDVQVGLACKSIDIPSDLSGLG
jgi:hypothetical protein